MPTIHNEVQIFEQVKTLRQDTFGDVFGESAAAKFRKEWEFVKTHIERNDKSAKTQVRLSNCTPQSIKDCMRDAIVMGLTFNPVFKEVYLVPYGTTCTLMIGYQGEINYLAKQQVIISADVGVVRSEDIWDYKKTDEDFRFNHKKPREGSRGYLQGAYCSYLLPNGSKHGDYFLKEAIEKRKAIAKSDSFWKQWPDEMYMKTAVRMARKGLPFGEAVAKLDLIDNQHSDVTKGPVEVSEERLNEIIAQFKMSLEADGLKGLNEEYLQLSRGEQENKKVIAQFAIIKNDYTKEQEKNG